MVSAIDPTVPVTGNPTTLSVRTNFQIAHNEISALQVSVGALAGSAPITSPVFNGNPQAPTPAPGDNDTSIATTAFVAASVVAATAGVATFNTRTGAVTLNPTDITVAGGAPLASPVFTGNPQAPTPAVGDNDTSVATTQFVATALQPVANNVGRNLIHNSRFRVHQRGTGPFTTTGFTADRWQQSILGSSMSTTITNYTDAQRAAIGDESAFSCLQATVGGTAGAGDYAFLSEGIEASPRLANKQVTVSFLAHATAGTPKLGIGLRQTYGTGGTPSASVDLTGQSVTLSTTPARYQVVFTLPSLAGQTFGTNGDSLIRAAFAFSAGSAVAGIFGNPGVQSGTFVISDVQLEVGGVSTPLEKTDFAMELINCQRFYQVGTMKIDGYAVAGGTVGCVQSFMAQMRAIPNVVPTWTVQSNCAANVLVLDSRAIEPYMVVTATGMASMRGTFTASAEL